MTKSKNTSYTVYTNFNPEPFNVLAFMYETGYDGGVTFTDSNDNVVAEFLTGVIAIFTN